MQVVAACDAGTGVLGQGTGREDILPAPFPVSVWVFARQGVGQVNGAVALGQILFVQRLHPLEVFLEERCKAVGQHRHPVLRPLAVADDEGSPLRFEILDAQAQAFHQSHAAAVDQLSHQLVCARQAADEARRLVLVRTVGSRLGRLARRASTGPALGGAPRDRERAGH